VSIWQSYPVERSWSIRQIDGADVRLRSSQSSGRVDVDVSAPVRAGDLWIQDTDVRMNLTIALDRIKTGNFLTDGAVRAFISGYRAHDLVYAGAGSTAGEAAEISGQASAGTIDTQIVLAVSPVGADWQSMNEIEIIGTAEFGRVHIPLPGVGTVDDLVVDIDARLAVMSA